MEIPTETDRWNDTDYLDQLQSGNIFSGDNGSDFLETGDNFSNFSLGNVTEIEPWRRALDLTATIIMTSNTITFMMGMGAATYWRELWQHLRRPFGAIIGMIGQFIVLPATAFGLAYAMQLSPYQALGVLIISCCPGGSFSNFFTFWVEGDLALSIVMTACSSILAFGGMPLNLWIYSRFFLEDGKSLTIPYTSIMVSLAFITLPVIVGMLIRHFSERIAGIITRVASLIGWVGCGTVIVIWLVLYWQVFARANPFIYLTAILLPFLGFSLAYLLALLFRRSHKTCRTIGIETGSQNMPLGLSIIILSFSDIRIKSEMLMFPTLYGITLLLEMFVGILAFQLYKRKCAKGETQTDTPMTRVTVDEKGTVLEKESLTV